VSLLSHDLEHSSLSSATSGLPRAGLTRDQRAALRNATLKKLSLCVLTLLLSGGALAAVIALRTAIYVSRLHLGAG
jgi:hypothetical protein